MDNFIYSQLANFALFSILFTSFFLFRWIIEPDHIINVFVGINEEIANFLHLGLIRPYAYLLSLFHAT